MRIAAVAGVLLVVSGVVAGCASTVDGEGSAAPGQVAAYQSALSASRAADAHDAGVSLCADALPTVDDMVRGYNDFVHKLSDVQDYGALGGLDDKARTSLTTGAARIRGKLTPSTPGDLAGPTNGFLDATQALGTAIGQHSYGGLNPLADTWNKDKDGFIDRCAAYLPSPPAGESQPGSSAPSTTPTG